MLGVVIPTLNCAATLPETLYSLQKLGGVAQVIVVDSSSSDGTPDIARRHGIEVLSTPAEGMYAAINEGLHRLETEWLCYRRFHRRRRALHSFLGQCGAGPIADAVSRRMQPPLAARHDLSSLPVRSSLRI
jgi:hypothetical protein